VGDIENKEMRKLDNTIKKQVVEQNAAEVLRSSLDDVRNENLDDTSLSDK
jgi:hypothetical protein